MTKITNKNNFEEEMFILDHDFRGSFSPWLGDFIALGLR